MMSILLSTDVVGTMDSLDEKYDVGCYYDDDGPGHVVPVLVVVAAVQEPS